MTGTSGTSGTGGGAPGGGTRPVRVLLSVRGPSPTTNPYVVQLARSQPPDVDVRFFTWTRGLLGRYDVLHVHWPEVLLRRAGRPARWAARARAALLVARLGLTRTPVLRTVHNTATHERGDVVERLLLAALERRVRERVLLSPSTPSPAGGVVVPHGHYGDWYAGAPRSEVVPGRLLFFGLLRPYKGVDTLLAAFAGLADPGARLRVVGAAPDPALRDAVAAAAAADPRAGARLEHVDDDDLAREVTAAQLVVLPYRDLHSSGALLLALSLGRPVLVPATATTLELRAEVGERWVHTHDGPLRPEDLARALAATADLEGAPDLSARDWSVGGARHAEVYRRLAGRDAG